LASDTKIVPGSGGGEVALRPMGQRTAISIKGLTPGVAFDLAACCHPIPGALVFDALDARVVLRAVVMDGRGEQHRRLDAALAQQLERARHPVLLHNGFAALVEEQAPRAAPRDDLRPVAVVGLADRVGHVADGLDHVEGCARRFHRAGEVVLPRRLVHVLPAPLRVV